MADPIDDEIIGSVSGKHPDAEALPLAVSPCTTGKGKNTIRMELLPVACWKMENLRFAFGSSFVLPGARKEFRALANLRKQHPGAPLSVFGHADPTGNDDFNKNLSGHRADSVYGILIRDTARWERLYQSGSSEGWGIGSVQRMLTAVGIDAGPPTGTMNAQTRQAVEQFQGANGLRVDGDPGPKTREKLFLAYMDFLSPEKLAKTDFLARGADAGGKGDVQGCGEFNPLRVFSTAETQAFARPENKSKRDADNEVNRRVMVLLFRPGAVVSPGKWVCPRTTEGTADCRKRFWSDAEKRRNPQAERREFDTTKDTFACRFYHRLVQHSPCEVINPVTNTLRIRLHDRRAQPLAFAPCVVTLAGQAAQARRSAADGFVTFQVQTFPATATVRWSLPASGDNAGSPPPSTAGTFDFSLDLTIEVPDPDSDEAARTRLHHLGYPLLNSETHMSPEDNIRKFQRDYKARFADIVEDGTLNAPTKNAIKTVHDACDLVTKGTGIVPR
jgi:hypothetical protein